MYNHKLILADQVFELAKTLPVVGDSAEICSTSVRVGGQEGRLAVTITAASATVTIEEDKVLTVSLQDSDDNSSFAALAPARSVVFTSTGGDTVYTLNDEILSMMIPRNTRKWVKVSITCTNVGGTDTLNVFTEYLAN